jgi:1-acyl-sn-glycerol-3-phosphate acyltransferase
VVAPAGAAIVSRPDADRPNADRPIVSRPNAGRPIVGRLVAAALPRLMLRALRRGLSGVWGAAAPAPSGGAVVVANHHSWWDGYLLWLTLRRASRRPGMVIDERTLDRFPFFRAVGGLAPTESRAAARRAAAGDWLVVFPEGAIAPAGRLAPFARGAEAISRWAHVPVVPIGVRVVMRGRQRPEAYLRVGDGLPSGASTVDQRAAVAALLRVIDRDVELAEEAEAPLAGYEQWLVGEPSTDERMGRLRRWWTR